ncbi:homing endonuclease associated repeat-containing protein [Psychromicrobium sp. YIM B11713]|uniref:homing endonuclease associated repeat-containing protein n=1 Tax=Psychromicrobium sp. YIM B11713 TaxID=3145233 RepID=UPI00374E439A
MLNMLCRLAQGEPTLGRRTYEQRCHDNDPSVHLYTHRFGSWGEALAAAGLTSTTQPLQLQDATTKMAKPQMVAALCIRGPTCRRQPASVPRSINGAQPPHKPRNLPSDIASWTAACTSPLRSV